MDNPARHYRSLRLAAAVKALTANNFDACLVPDRAAARALVLDEILPRTGARTVSWGGSGTFLATGLYDALKNHERLQVLDTYDKTISRADMLERRRQALLVDLFFTGTNAVTETGKLVNLDMYGNRVAGLTFGPLAVVVLAGANKLVADGDAARARIKSYASPVNAMRLDKKTPCVRTGRCEDCRSPERICNTWTITEKSFPKGRIKVVLIDEELGI
ncbi:MAG: lactate utilization protein [Desulfovibrionaceae bacterium]|jgi:hypothetical protein|nr:lactate utilization protein [Desulfovibrionaceae bacterium]